MRIRRGPRREESIPFLPIYGALTVLIGGSAAAWGFLFPGAHLPACPFHALTGLPCPTCGTTRALAALTHGRIAAALAWNPLAAVAAVSCLLAGAASTARRLTGLEAVRLETSPKEQTAARVGAILLIGANWAYLVARGL